MSAGGRRVPSSKRTTRAQRDRRWTETAGARVDPGLAREGPPGLVWSRRTGEVLFVGGRADGTRPSAPCLRPERSAFSGERRPVSPARRSRRMAGFWSSGRRPSSVLFKAPGIPERDSAGWTDAVQPASRPMVRRFSSRRSARAGPARGRLLIGRPTGGPRSGSATATPQGFSPDGKWILTITAVSPPELVMLPVGAGNAAKDPEPRPQSDLAFIGSDKSVTVLSSAPGQPTKSYILDLNGASKPALVDLPRDQLGCARRSEPPTEGSSRIPHGSQDPAHGRRRQARADPERVLAPGGIHHGLQPRPAILPDADPGGDSRAKIYRTDLKTGAKTLWKEIQPADRSGVIGIDEVHFTPDQTAYAYTYGGSRTRISTSSRG